MQIVMLYYAEGMPNNVNGMHNYFENFKMLS